MKITKTRITIEQLKERITIKHLPLTTKTPEPRADDQPTLESRNDPQIDGDERKELKQK